MKGVRFYFILLFPVVLASAGFARLDDSSILKQAGEKLKLVNLSLKDPGLGVRDRALAAASYLEWLVLAWPDEASMEDAERIASGEELIVHERLLYIVGRIDHVSHGTCEDELQYAPSLFWYFPYTEDPLVARRQYSNSVDYLKCVVSSSREHLLENMESIMLSKQCIQRLVSNPNIIRFADEDLIDQVVKLREFEFGEELKRESLKYAHANFKVSEDDRMQALAVGFSNDLSSFYANELHKVYSSIWDNSPAAFNSRILSLLDRLITARGENDYYANKYLANYQYRIVSNSNALNYNDSFEEELEWAFDDEKREAIEKHGDVISKSMGIEARDDAFEIGLIDIFFGAIEMHQ